MAGEFRTPSGAASRPRARSVRLKLLSNAMKTAAGRAVPGKLSGAVFFSPAETDYGLPLDHQGACKGMANVLPKEGVPSVARLEFLWWCARKM